MDKLLYVNVDVKIHNEREMHLINVFENRCTSYVKDYFSEFWQEQFEKEEDWHYRLLECKGLVDAMFFLGMIEEPISNIELYQILKEEAKKKSRKE